MGSLRFDKLFHVLVVLGAASCGEDDSERRDRDVDAAVSNTTDAAVSSTIDASVEEGSPCFCDVAACCDRTGSTPVLQAGFTCCWSTTCD